jgi:hypothetical protein
VEQHNTTDDCWIVIKGHVYDVTDFAPMHPGGRAIYTMGGRVSHTVHALPSLHTDNTPRVARTLSTTLLTQPFCLPSGPERAC